MKTVSLLWSRLCFLAQRDVSLISFIYIDIVIGVLYPSGNPSILIYFVFRRIFFSAPQ